ncbi:AbrB/MazE/SpoVT family DNA-binding domain-containing protein [Acidocella sp.]|uniref:AbrB/MazE/SpoVT family DNA-binding domain-containing protein n=1 Tax=Acidocella sp. TaxID=50710 RepID=UPI00261CD722|nr:AbrB/MazE/SpoVT family DNA-binding domain-containing protein [Acidocella sp.]
MITSKMTAKAQTTIPQAVRRHLGVAEGDLLGFILDGERVLLVKPVVKMPGGPVSISGEWESEADQRAFYGL